MQVSSANNLFSPVSEKPGSNIDVRARMAVSLLMSALAIGISSPEGQLVLFASSLFYLLSIRRWKAMAIAYALLVAMMAIAAACTYILSLFAPAMPFSLKALSVPFLRSADMLNVILPLALTNRIQELLTALKGLRLPFCIYIPTAVMIRFIPTFMNDIRQIAETLKIRGCHITASTMIRHPLLMLRLLFTPLLFRSLRTSEELGIAAELKGLEAGNRFVPLRTHAWSGIDSLLIVLALMASITALYVNSVAGTAVSAAMH